MRATGLVLAPLLAACPGAVDPPAAADSAFVADAPDGRPGPDAAHPECLPGELPVWVEGSLVRVARDAPLGTRRTAELWAAGGEVESFQIAVRGPAGGLTGVDVSVTELTGPRGIIPAARVALFREHYVQVVTGSPDWWGGTNLPGGPGLYPDALLPFVDPETGAPPAGADLVAAPFAVEAGEVQPIWVDVAVPRGVAAGAYTGAIRVTAAEGGACLPVTVHTLGVDLPLRSALETSFPFRSEQPLASLHELLRHRLGPGVVPVAEQRGLIEDFGLGSVGLGFWSGADIASCAMGPPPSVAEIEATVARADPDLHLFNYSADEIGACAELIPTIQAWARNLHEAGVDQLITMAPIPELYDDGSGSGRSAVDIWVMLPKMAEESAAEVATVKAKGDQVWSYNCLVQDGHSPKWEIDFSPLDFRLHAGALSHVYGMTGLLYWRVDLWTADPWNDVGAYETGGYAFPGEGMLVYPGGPAGLVGVAPSMRLKWLRDGVEDYDLLALLVAKGQGALALSLASGVAPDWSGWTRDPAAVEAFHRQVWEALVP